MGYHTEFEGKLTFVNELTIPQLAELQSMMGEDCRNHPEWEAKDLYYVDLRVTKDYSGIEWNSDTEKTYDLEKIVNVVIRQMRKRWPDFGLTGSILAQGDEIGDVWILRINNEGWAERADVPTSGSEVTCPHCKEKFAL